MKYQVKTKSLKDWSQPKSSWSIGLDETSDHNKNYKYWREIIFDGKVWHDFQDFNGKPFLREPFTFGLMMNVDWFKAYKHLEYKIGAIYLTVMNLPRELRLGRKTWYL